MARGPRRLPRSPSKTVTMRALATHLQPTSNKWHCWWQRVNATSLLACVPVWLCVAGGNALRTGVHTSTAPTPAPSPAPAPSPVPSSAPAAQAASLIARRAPTRWLWLQPFDTDSDGDGTLDCHDERTAPLARGTCAHAVASPTPGQVSHLQRGRVVPLTFAALRGRCPSVCALFIRDARGVATNPLQAVGDGRTFGNTKLDVRLLGG